MQCKIFFALPAGPSSDQQSSSAPSAAPRRASAGPWASGTCSGRPRSRLPATCSSAQAFEPADTQKRGFTEISNQEHTSYE